MTLSRIILGAMLVAGLALGTGCKKEDKPSDVIEGAASNIGEAADEAAETVKEAAE